MTSALDGVGGRHAPAAFTPGKDAVPTVKKTGVWIGAENVPPIGIGSSDLPARSESLIHKI